MKTMYYYLVIIIILVVLLICVLNNKKQVTQSECYDRKMFDILRRMDSLDKGLTTIRQDLEKVYYKELQK